VALIRRYPELNVHQGFAMVYHWLLSGAKTAFVQDANSLIMPTDRLVEVLRYLRTTFPSIVRVTSYARSKTLAQKKPDELLAIRQAGLDRLHVGLETGDDELLQKVKKGVTAEDPYQRRPQGHGRRFSALRVLDARAGRSRPVGKSCRAHGPSIKRHQSPLYSLPALLSQPGKPYVSSGGRG